MLLRASAASCLPRPSCSRRQGKRLTRLLFAALVVTTSLFIGLGRNPSCALEVFVPAFASDANPLLAPTSSSALRSAGRRSDVLAARTSSTSQRAADARSVDGSFVSSVLIAAVAATFAVAATARATLADGVRLRGVRLVSTRRSTNDVPHANWKRSRSLCTNVGAEETADAQERSSVEASAPPWSPPPVWVVNLDQSTDRWKLCEHEFNQHGVAAERFPATLGKALSDDELNEQCTFGARYLCTAGMIGCFVSHRRVWQRVVDEGLPAVVVLEDDVVIYPNFNERLRDLLLELPEDWDVCLLGAVGCVQTDVEPLHMKLFGLFTGGGRPSPGRTRKLSENVYVPYRPAGTHAYIVSQRGARKLLELCPKVRYHVDLTAWSLRDLRLYAATKFLATQRFDDDTTVSKGGAPLTKRFLLWCWEVTGLASMGRRGGLSNMTWAWKIAVFALPLPGKRRLIVEMGPSSSFFVVLMIVAICSRSFWLAGLAMAYMSSVAFIVRWLAGTQSFTTMFLLSLLSASLLYLG
eukprot:TRINITY_DN26777_c0_g1_i1.p1 TRINITY_DN26777_c0_g1~~TRINITY_DN26777_c0_g1_i1.p1  ORF type:complete len:524 (-),score=60.13 TRINITY_DN26777_c0_g1_i1:284-1855(-)